MGCSLLYHLFAFSDFFISKLILSLSPGSNAFELLLIFSWDHVLPHMCVVSLEIGELELSVQWQVQADYSEFY